MISRSVDRDADDAERTLVSTDGLRITLQFHLDWPHDGRKVIESMAEGEGLSFAVRDRHL